ncbi:2-polyprenyl-6-methoxyphenol hydroxylase-like FAD-dependent oxidoreductase [Pseudoduganella lurida]|uniref:2-polyprenyl-6-methoxyphenol hydroxylase-like FAD-dependent oxidoreductase n=1 Tax=Pseudoduganella lurida TaxID=1036180 RepID=A0A562QY46_9BURK|nr:FAD-dependent monooxygenase [Pseudoduganella lurida]TWI61234.1 2-polyprenyl-6-methoxyphenol hydroxylase-like FAD-dependent oxidoreductase [Pseudoduganella lurida]
MDRRILVTGASVAGTTAAWWLTQQGFGVDVVERAPAFRDGGQNVDVRGSAREVLRRMGLEERAFARSTRERGTDWVDEDDSVIARFEAGDSDNDSGPTAELEIRRGDIARIIHDAARERAAFRFGDSIASLAQDASGVDVAFASGRQARYDIVVVAEGVGSHTRELVFPGENEPRWMDLTIAYFSIPAQPGDSPYARQYNTVHGRGATLKQALDGKLGAYLGIQKKPEGEHAWDVERQRRFIENRFADDGWEIPRILAAMRDVDDFYFDVLRQVRMPRWSDGRVVLTGDAAWCPTPLTGIGTTLALVGGYVLAGELAQAPDPASAFEAYERVMRPFVEKGQDLPKIVPRLLWPHSEAGLALMRGAMRVAGMPVISKAIQNGFARDPDAIDLPDY